MVFLSEAARILVKLALGEIHINEQNVEKFNDTCFKTSFYEKTGVEPILKLICSDPDYLNLFLSRLRAFNLRENTIFLLSLASNIDVMFQNKQKLFYIK